MRKTQDFIALNAFYGSLTDEKLVNLAAANNTYALDEIISRYKNLVRSRARRYFLAGADTDDIIQEGMIGLFKAIKNFKKSKQSSFSSFAALCVTRQILTAIKTAARYKHLPLNTFVPLNQSAGSNNSRLALIERMSEKTADNPEAMLLIKEQLSNVKNRIKNELSPFEHRVLVLYLNGYSYNSISVKLNVPVKSIDNALQRIKRKLSKKTN